MAAATPAAPTNVQSKQAEKAAGNKTIAAGLPANGKFMAAAKAAGLDQTLAGPGPYTVFVPTDDAIGKAPAGIFDTAPGNRAQLTGIITNLVLPGTVLVADIDKAIDAGKGKAPLATMGGGTLTATKEGGNTVITDSRRPQGDDQQGRRAVQQRRRSRGRCGADAGETVGAERSCGRPEGRKVILID